MRSKLYHLGLIASSTFTLLTLAAAPVYAQHGVDNSSSASATSSKHDTTDPVSDDKGGLSGPDKSTATSKSTTESQTETEHGVEAQDVSSTEFEHTKQSVQTDAQKLLAAKRQAGKEHTQAERKKVCELRQNSINTRSNLFSTAAQRHLDTYNSIFTKVKAFQDKKQLSVSNYDALVATATAKQATAQTAVDTLKALDVKIDCTATDPASNVAELKTAVSNAHTALKDYRQSIRDIVSALKAAASPDNSTAKTEDN